MAASGWVALRPSEISGMLGRKNSWTDTRPGLRRLDVPLRFALNSGLSIAVLYVSLASTHTLYSKHGNPSALRVIFHGTFLKSSSQVSLPFVYDVVALVAVFTALITPVFLYHQAVGIGEFVETNLGNIQYRTSTLDRSAINDAATKANARFHRWGGPWASRAILVVALLAGGGLIQELQWHGVFSTWNSTNLTNAAWRTKAYANWWANEHTHPWNSILLTAVATYFFYFLSKQLLMGFVFAQFLVAVAPLGVSAFPTVGQNADGFWGMRSLRRFLQWTYGSALTHLIQSLFVLSIWVPFGSLTVFVILFVFFVNACFVIYPTLIAIRGITNEKAEFVKQLYGSAIDLPSEETIKRVEDIWKRPTLPFRLGSSLSAVSLYLLVPVALVVVSRILGVNK
jgi:hypothetical protein